MWNYWRYWRKLIRYYHCTILWIDKPHACVPEIILPLYGYLDYWMHMHWISETTHDNHWITLTVVSNYCIVGNFWGRKLTWIGRKRAFHRMLNWLPKWVWHAYKLVEKTFVGGCKRNIYEFHGLIAICEMLTFCWSMKVVSLKI